MGAQVPLRERRRAATVAEIKAIAMAHLASGGAGALSLRAVARDLGVSVQALYHYFPSREALLTALVTDAFTSLGDAVRAGGQAGSTRAERIIGAGQAYRRWAHEHRPAFLLALGAPLPDYAAPEGGPTTLAATRMGEAFQHVVFDGWTADEARAVQLAGAGPAAPGEGSLDDGPKGLPPGALALFAMGWSGLHGFVMLEVSGHLSWLGDSAEQTCQAVLSDYAAAVERARTGSSQA